MNLPFSAACFAAAIFLSSTVKAEPACVPITRANLVSCALRASGSVRSARHTLGAAEAREVAAAPLLPSNPTIEFLGARRDAPGGERGVHWSATLSQEFEVGGQRGARREEAAASSAAEQHRFAAERRRVAAVAWVVFFDLARARRQHEIAERLETIARQVREIAKAMSAVGSGAGIDADLAEMSWSRARVRLLTAEADVRAEMIGLMQVVGADPTASGSPSVGTDLEPVAGVAEFGRRALAGHGVGVPEVRALEAERRAFQAHASALRRSRVPNVTLSGFFEQDDFEGRLIGGAISIPIPLPEPLGRTASGEIAEAEALAARARSEAQRVQRENRAELTRALSAYESRRRELAAFDPRQSALAESSLAALGSEIRAGRMAVKDALVIEAQLVEFMQARIDAEYGVCVASVALAQAAGYPLEGGQP